ncbi:MAG TPA: FAD-binding oxidoreductase [Candidatus Acidoferrales bacterium]|nr:FAD-binding oxidoreductase [Candidatus Acidoferrales bacterium]
MSTPSRLTRRQFISGAAAFTAVIFADRSGLAGSIDRNAFARLARRLKGRLILPHEPGYQRARVIHNGRFDNFPAAIAKCLDSSDVQRAVEFARVNALPVAVRSGGHDYAGYSTCDYGMVIDLCAMREVVVDRRARIATIQMGAKIGHLYDSLWKDGFTATAGTCASVGMGGLTLGGGIGPLACKYGLACDNMLSAEVVLADGSIVHADGEKNSDLFWAIRGGGGNFGIVTQIEMRVFEIPRVLSGELSYSAPELRDQLRFYRDFIRTAPDELSTEVSIAGGNTLSISVCYTGDLDEGVRVLSPLLRFGTPGRTRLRAIAPPHAFISSAGRAGVAELATGAFFPELKDAAIDTICESIQAAPPGAEVGLDDLRGATMIGTSAFPIRSAGFDSWILADWARSRDGAAATSWVNDTRDALLPFSSGVYVNRLNREGEARVREAYGENYDRLSTIKALYDPQNVFHLNQNIVPA